ncbi:MAG: hypothetical protein ABJ013_14955 [Halioglobus sp.]
MITSLLLISVISTLAAIAVCRWVGLVDNPSDRKRHVGNIPLSGGIAVFITIVVSTFALNIPAYTPTMLTIAILVFGLGVFDDFRHITPWLRLSLQYGAGVALATYGGIAIHNVGNLLALGDIPLLMLAVPLTALAVAGLSNAYNMIDGIDGLSASLMLVPLAVLSTLAALMYHPMLNSLLVMAVPLIVFLLFNLGPNTKYLPKIFLGDGGSITMGFLITASLVFFSQGDSAIIHPVTALWLVTIPLMDMLATMARRARKGRKLMEADRYHLHYSLIDLGLSPGMTLLLLVVYAVACAFIGLFLESLPDYISMFSFFALFIVHLTFVAKVSRSVDAKAE